MYTRSKLTPLYGYDADLELFNGALDSDDNDISLLWTSPYTFILHLVKNHIYCLNLPKDLSLGES